MSVLVRGSLMLVQDLPIRSDTPLNQAVCQALYMAYPSAPAHALPSRVQEVLRNGHGAHVQIPDWQSDEQPAGHHHYQVRIVEDSVPQSVQGMIDRAVAQASVQLQAQVDGLSGTVAAQGAELAAVKDTVAAIAWRPVTNLAAQIALLAVGASQFRTIKSARFTHGCSGSALSAFLTAQGVTDADAQLDALVTGRNASVHPAPLLELKAEAGVVQSFITPQLRACEPLACMIVERFDDILAACNDEGFKGV